jgi:TetR/AcrR family transcriptional regulator, mexJK operon transcriptional repressor
MQAQNSRKWRADDPRRLRMAETRAAILRAARPIMLRDGLGGTTLDRVAAEGGIAKMTLYRHFPSKEALFEGLVTATSESMREGLENAPAADADKPIAMRLADELSAFTSALIEPDGLALYRLIVADGWRFPELARVFDRSGMRVIRRRLAECLKRVACPPISRGKLRASLWRWRSAMRISARFLASLKRGTARRLRGKSTLPCRMG